MLHVLRKHSRSLLIYILFGIVIAVFIINFGPGSTGCESSIAQGYAARVGGEVITEQDFVHALQLLGGDDSRDSARSRMMRQYLMELLLQRELMAQEAERMGFRVSDEEIEDRIAQGRIVLVGQPRNISMDPRFASIYQDGFDYEKWRKSFCNYFLHTTPRKFIAEQRREYLADKLRNVVMVSTKVAPDEVKRDYVDRETQVKLAFVRFSAKRFEDEGEIAPADLDAYLEKNKDKVKQQYDSRAFLYKAVPKEARLRIVLVATKPNSSKEEVARAEGRARSLADRVHAGADFAKLAREASDDDKSKPRGGSLGWRRQGTTGFGPQFEQAVFALKKGETSGALKTDRGFVIARLEDFREGDLPFDAVARELAEDLLRKERAGTRAKQQAEAAMGKIRAGAALESLFPKEEKDADTQSSEGTEKPGASARPATAQEGGGAPSSSARRGGGILPPSGKKGKTPPAAAADQPKLQETGMFGRRGNALEEIGVSKDAVAKVFGDLKKSETAGPFEVSAGLPSYVIVKLVERKDADLAAFEAKREELAREFAASKWASVWGDLAHRRCVEMRDAGKIRVNTDILTLGQQDGAGYTPCMGLGLR